PGLNREVAAVPLVLQEPTNGFLKPPCVGPVGSVLPLTDLALAPPENSQEVICKDVPLRLHVEVTQLSCFVKLIVIPHPWPRNPYALYRVAELILPDVRHFMNEKMLHVQRFTGVVLPVQLPPEIDLAVRSHRSVPGLQA